uniref:DNA-directed RNA polymerase n=1 Tax=Nelumbo nucifera TaxID=4432 RepID=A0A822Z0K3_NELNU|nr:TPA_asm: hypothetical protein HUJ06_007842 [Nelumbo nucifera]
MNQPPEKILLRWMNFQLTFSADVKKEKVCGDLVELGEAVGIIAGQSIGEPGTLN